jgi:hypothetical protein
MNRFKSFHFAVICTFLIAAALPAAAKPGPDQDCDSAGGEIALQGTLTIQSVTPLSSCVTQIEVSGLLSGVSRIIGSPDQQKETAEVSLTITSITSVGDGGATQSVSMTKGTVKFFNESKGFGRMMDISGVISPDSEFAGTLEQKKGLNAVNVKQAIMAGLTGQVYFNPKEISVDKAIPVRLKGHTYIGTVTIVK